MLRGCTLDVSKYVQCVTQWTHIMETLEVYTYYIYGIIDSKTVAVFYVC